MTEVKDYPASVTFMPGMRGGVPTIGGTRLPLATVLEHMWVDGIQFVMNTWEITREQALVAAWFAGTYGIDDLPTDSGRRRGGEWQKRYRQWATSWHGHMWGDRWEKVPDPPCVDDTYTESATDSS